MWLGVGIASGAAVIVLAVLRRIMKRRPRTIDVGSVSEAWLAEQRGRRDSSM